MNERDEINTERLRLRTPEATDAQRVASFIGEKEVAWNLGRAPYPYTEQDARDWIDACATSRENGTEHAFGVELPGEGLIGSCGVTLHHGQWEIGYWIGKPYWGQGYVTEAARGVLAWAETTLEAKGFMSGHYTDNPASGAVLVKLGFKPVGEVAWFARARGIEVPATRYIRGDASAEIALHWPTH